MSLTSCEGFNSKNENYSSKFAYLNDVNCHIFLRSPFVAFLSNFVCLASDREVKEAKNLLSSSSIWLPTYKVIFIYLRNPYVCKD